MTPAELVRADHETMLIVGSFANALQDPASFERFVDRMFNEWERRDAVESENRVNAANQAVDVLGRIQASRGTQPDSAATATINNAKSPQASGDGPAKAV
jgi:hypothetical protein